MATIRCNDPATGVAGDHRQAGMWQQSRQARQVLRLSSTSFFIVTRFLPPAKRAQVEAIYAAVRYPDEIVQDSFALPTPERTQLLNVWAAHFEAAVIIACSANESN
ncbi:MAG: squalene/phytoene synthase family protein [Blastocatellia bacterium]